MVSALLTGLQSKGVNFPIVDVSEGEGEGDRDGDLRGDLDLVLGLGSISLVEVEGPASRCSFVRPSFKERRVVIISDTDDLMDDISESTADFHPSSMGGLGDGGSEISVMEGLPGGLSIDDSRSLTTLGGRR